MRVKVNVLKKAKVEENRGEGEDEGECKGEKK